MPDRSLNRCGSSLYPQAPLGAEEAVQSPGSYPRKQTTLSRSAARGAVSPVSQLFMVAPETPRAAPASLRKSPRRSLAFFR